MNCSLLLNRKLALALSREIIALLGRVLKRPKLLDRAGSVNAVQADHKVFAFLLFAHALVEP